jgi:hypothetical protein
MLNLKSIALQLLSKVMSFKMRRFDHAETSIMHILRLPNVPYPYTPAYSHDKESVPVPGRHKQLVLVILSPLFSMCTMENYSQL